MRLPFLRKKPREQRVTEDPPNRTGARRVEAGQLSRPTTMLAGRFTGTQADIVPRPNSTIFEIDVTELKRYSPSLLLKNLHSISPDVSMALWTILRLVGTEFSWRVYDPAGKQSVKGQAYVDHLMETLGDESGGPRNLVSQFVKSIYMQGACSAEVVLKPNLRDVHKFIAVDPGSVTFFREKRGEGEMEEIVYVPYQLQNGKYVSLEKEGFYYVPLDPDAGDPYGTCPILSIISTIFFYLRVIYDLNQVVHNQAWERMHVQVLEEVLRKNVSDQLRRNDEKMADYIDRQLDKIQAVYDSLDPDDTFVTTDATTIETVGGKHSGGIVSVKVLLEVLDRMLANSLKTMSSFLNQHKGKTETYSSVEWMIQVSGIEAIRDVVKSLMDNALSFMLQVKGIRGRVEIEFPEIPLDGAETQERVKFFRSRRVLMERDAGIISHDHAANLLYDIPEAEGEEEPMEQSKNIAIGRGLADKHQGGWYGIKNSRLRNLEKSFSAELRKKYRDLAEAVIDRLSKEVEFEDE